MRPERLPWRYVLAWLAVVAIAVLVHRPDRALPFDLWDFHEFLPILREHGGLADDSFALLDYYREQGRMNALFYLTFVVQYALFGEHAQGWQVARFLLMTVNIGLVFAVGRRLGFGWMGVASTGVLLTLGTPVARGWVQLMAEPMALAFLLLMLLIGWDYQRTERWQLRAILVLTLLALVFQSKEILGVPGVAVIAFTLHGTMAGSGRRPLLDRRNVVLVAGAAVVVILEGLLLLLVREAAPASGYGMSYGSGGLTIAHLAQNLAAILVPMRPSDSALAALYPANVLALLLAGLGAAAWWRRPRAEGATWRIGAGLGIAVLGAVLYLPWPKFDSFYALPFAVGPALLLGAAADALVRAGGARHLIAVICVSLIAVYLGLATSRSVETQRAGLLLTVEVSKVVARMSPTDTMLVLGPDDPARALSVRAWELRGYAAVLAHRDEGAMPVLRDATCSEAVPLLEAAAGRLEVTTFRHGCGLLRDADLRLSAVYQWRDWMSWARHADSLQVDLSGPGVRRALGLSVTAPPPPAPPPPIP